MYTPNRATHILSAGLLFGAVVCAQPVSEPADEPETVELPIFEVTTGQDAGYQSLNTISGTRTNELLSNVPSPISVVNRELLDDIAAKDIFDAVEFSVGAELVNQNGTGVGGDASGGNAVLFRGIQNNWQSRDGFQWYTPSDTFNTERVESNRGPTGQLYGDAAATGILNISTKQANFSDRTVVSMRFDDNDSKRATIDVNKRLTAHHAARLNVVGSDERFWKDTAFDRRWGYALATGSRFLGGRTTFRTNWEFGEINRVPLNGQQLDFYRAYVPGTGSVADLNPAQPGVQNPAGTGPIQLAGNTQRWTLIDGQLYNLESTGNNAGGANAVYFRQSGGGNPVQGVDESLIPREQQWNGPSNRVDRDYFTVTGTLDHRFSEKLWVQLSYNLQDTTQTNTNVAFANQVRVDVNPSLPNPSGAGLIANSRYEQLYVEHTYRGQTIDNYVENYRAMVVYDFDALDFMSQRVVATASIRDEVFLLRFSEENLTPAATAALGLAGPAALPVNNPVTRRYYLGEGPGQLGYDPRPDSAFFASRLLGSQHGHQVLTSYSVNLFGRYWGERFTTSLGVRRDNYDRDNATFTADGNGIFSSDGDFQPFADLDNTSWNYGGVWHAVPWMSLFANYAETFQFNGVGFYFNGDAIPPRLGEGYDYGVRLNLLDNRLNAIVTLFDNSSKYGSVNAVNTEAMAEEINNLLDPLGRRFTSGRDAVDTNSTGVEVELVGNPTPNLTLRAAISYYDRTDENFAPRLFAVLEQMRVEATDPAQYALTEARYNQLLLENARTRTLPNLAVRYRWTEGPLRGVFAGLSGFWREVDLPSGTDDYINANLLLGYRAKLFGTETQFQLNVENLLDEDNRLSDPPSLSYLAPRSVVFTTTVSF